MRGAREHEDAAPLASVVVMIATAVALVRVLIEISVVAPRLFAAMVAPIFFVLIVAIILSIIVWSRLRGTPVARPEQENPTMLRAALTFGAMFAVVLLAVAWVKERMAGVALYVVAAVAGLTDVDAITLSIGRMATVGEIDAGQAWRLILIAYLSNLLFKIAIVAIAGSRRLLLRVALLFAVLGVAGGLMILLYP